MARAVVTEHRTHDLMHHEVLALHQRDLQMHFQVPQFEHSYPVHPPHPQTARFAQLAHEWLESFGVDRVLGREAWRGFLKGDCPSIQGYIFGHMGLDSQTLLWLMKNVCWLFALDTLTDEGENVANYDETCKSLLDIILVLMWPYPEDARFSRYVLLFSQSFTSARALALLLDFENNLALVRSGEKSIFEVELCPLGAAIRDNWREYCEDVPLDIAVREAHTFLEYVMMGVGAEAKMRKASVRSLSVVQYVYLRRMTTGVNPYLVCCDYILARQRKGHTISDELFHSSLMQEVRDCITDIIGWHNDVFSFHKECVRHEDIHNLVWVVFKQCKCSSLLAAVRMVYDLVKRRIEDMEAHFVKLRASAAVADLAGLDLVVEVCRSLISGINEWSMRCGRYASPAIAFVD